MSKKLSSFFILLHIFLLFLPLCCNAESVSPEIVFEYSNINLKREDDLCISSKIYSPYQINLSSLEMKINFDTKKFAFKDSYYTSNNEKIQFVTNHIDNTIKLLYTNTDGLNIDTNKPQNIFDIHLKVIKDAPFGITDISFSIENICDSNLIPIEINKDLHQTLNIVPVETPPCTLKTLSPSVGSFNIPFSPNIYNYSVDVPYNTKDITFDFEACYPESSVKIKRHKLNAAGASTEIKIIVSNKKAKTKSTYTITVNRAPKPPKEENKHNNTPNKSKDKSEKQSTSKKKSKIKSSNPKFYSEDALSEDEYDIPDERMDREEENKECEEPEEIEDDKEDIETSDAKTDNYKPENTQIDPDGTVPTNTQNFTDTPKNNYSIVFISSVFFTISIFLYSTIEILKYAKNLPCSIRRNDNNTIYLN